MKSVQTKLTAMISVPWNAFVAAFLYYTALAAIALGGVSPSPAVVGTAYLAPVIAYLVTISARVAAAVLAVPQAAPAALAASTRRG